MYSERDFTIHLGHLTLNIIINEKKIIMKKKLSLALMRNLIYIHKTGYFL